MLTKNRTVHAPKHGVSTTLRKYELEMFVEYGIKATLHYCSASNLMVTICSTVPREEAKKMGKELAA